MTIQLTLLVAMDGGTESNGGTFQAASNLTGGKELYAGLEERKGDCHTLGPSSAVMSSLPGALEWIRSCARRNPQLQIQVCFSYPMQIKYTSANKYVLFFP